MRWRYRGCSDRPGVERCLRSPPDLQWEASREGINSQGPGKPRSGTSECPLVYPMWSCQASSVVPFPVSHFQTYQACSACCLPSIGFSHWNCEV
jgi:hypothetical protein